MDFLHSFKWQDIAVALTLIAAVSTLVLGILDRVEKSRSLTTVMWSFKYAGEVLQNNRPIAHLVRLANVGTTSATIIGTFLVGTSRLTVNNKVPGGAFPAGRTVDIQVAPCEPSSVWLVIVYIDSADSRWLHVTWTALAAGRLRDRQVEQSREAQPSFLARLIPLYRYFRRRQIGPVGPDGALHVRIRRNTKKTKTHFDEALSSEHIQDAGSIHE
ncbi:hypothetical protein [Microbacterium sp. YY-01]|uniref:hypothetical protein n=1 Tax=Microbacterium sp. YY-01 TaxID=3421634 RepID=UPI003D1839DF